MRHQIPSAIKSHFLSLLSISDHPGMEIFLLGKNRGCKYMPKESFGEGNGTPLQYFCLENPMDGGAW